MTDRNRFHLHILPGCQRFTPREMMGRGELSTRWRKIHEIEGRVFDPPEMCPNCITPWKCNGPHEPGRKK